MQSGSSTGCLACTDSAQCRLADKQSQHEMLLVVVVSCTVQVMATLLRDRNALASTAHVQEGRLWLDSYTFATLNLRSVAQGVVLLKHYFA